MSKYGIKLKDIPENSNKRTTTVTFGIETDNLELYRRAAYDTAASSVADILRECIEIGFPIFCERMGINPAVPKKRLLTEEEEDNRKKNLEKRLKNLKGYKKEKEV